MIYTLCCTKGRPEQCLTMLQSYRDTIKTNNQIALLISSGEDVNAYEPCFKLADKYKIFPKTDTVTEMINSSIRLFDSDIKYYHLTNDDVVYKTQGWDKEFLELLSAGDGIAYGNDLFQGENLPTFPFISADIVRALGWLQMPTLNKYCGDVVWKHIGQTLECLYYAPNVILEHNHFLADKGEKPKDYEEIYHRDLGAFAQWLTKTHIDLDKICHYIHKRDNELKEIKRITS